MTTAVPAEELFGDDVAADAAELAGEVVVAAGDMVSIGHNRLAVGSETGDHER